MPKRCTIIPPRKQDIIGERHDGYLPACILPSAHRSDSHLFKTPEGVYYVWGDDMGCGCCEPDEDDRCIFYSEITEDEAEKMLKKGRG